MNVKKLKIKAILAEHLVLPVLQLKETHPDHYFTEKGYDHLLDEAYKAIKEYLKD